MKKVKMYKFSKKNLSFLQYYCEMMDRKARSATDRDEADYYEANSNLVREVAEIVSNYSFSPYYAELSGYRWKIAMDATNRAKEELFGNMTPMFYSEEESV